MTLDQNLIKILQCPDCQGGIAYKDKPEKLWCTTCKRVFGIKGGVPRMIPKKSA